MTDPNRQSMDVDIVCVGFGPATAGFLHTLSNNLVDETGKVLLESKVAPGMPLQVICYERADDIGFGVSGVVSRAKAIKQSLSQEELNELPMSGKVKKEELLYLLDPVGASRRSLPHKVLDTLLKPFSSHSALKVPYIPSFMDKHDGLIFSLGQFMQWIGTKLMGTGLVQIWPAMPVSGPLWQGDKVTGVRLLDQGTDKYGKPDSVYMPGMDINASLTVVGDGPVGPVGQQINQKLGMPEGNHQRDWAVGMKAVVDLPQGCKLEAGTVLHTMGFPEPEIFGFLYVLPGNIASLGIFVPSWFKNPIRNAYRYFQHWMQHPSLWQHLKGAKMRSWGAKSLQESGRKGEPHLVGDGFARIGEGSGSTNVLTNSGVDEAWLSGVLLAQGVIELAGADKAFTRDNLNQAYLGRRRASWMDKDSIIAEGSRDSFQKSFFLGVSGMGLSGLSNGLLKIKSAVKPIHENISSMQSYFKDKISPKDLSDLRKACKSTNSSLYNAIMDKIGWPEIKLDGSLLISHQDALLLGGKVQAAGGYADHVCFLDPAICEKCDNQVCIEMCSGQALLPGQDNNIPLFDREKCVHCGACFWNCSVPRSNNAEIGNVDFRAGSGGLHSAEN